MPVAVRHAQPKEKSRHPTILPCTYAGRRSPTGSCILVAIRLNDRACLRTSSGRPCHGPLLRKTVLRELYNILMFTPDGRVLATASAESAFSLLHKQKALLPVQSQGLPPSAIFLSEIVSSPRATAGEKKSKRTRAN